MASLQDFYSSAAAEVVAKYLRHPADPSVLDIDPEHAASFSAKKPWLTHTNTEVNVLNQLRAELKAARQESNDARAEVRNLRAEALSAQARAVNCESTSHELEKAAATNGHTTDNLRDIVLSQEAKITTLEAELRITKQREAHFSNELSVAQQVIDKQQYALKSADTIRGAAQRTSPSHAGLPGAFSGATGDWDLLNSSLRSPASCSSPAQGWSPAPAPVYSSYMPQTSPSMSSAMASPIITHSLGASTQPGSSSKDRTTALLAQVHHLQDALNMSLEKREELTEDAAELTVHYQHSLNQTQDAALDATTGKWRANLQANLVETEHETYLARIRQLEHHMLALQSQNEALRNEREGWLPAAIQSKVKSVIDATVSETSPYKPIRSRLPSPTLSP